MQLLLSKNVEGINRLTNETRLHGKSGDVLFILLVSNTYYVCDSKYFPNQEIIVFKSQVERLLIEANGVLSSEEQALSDEFSISGDNSPRDIDSTFERESSST
jgi:hypothetical protein